MKRVAYADPPYPGCADKYEDHPDYAGEVDHGDLIEQLLGFDGWALSTHVRGLELCQSLLRQHGLVVNDDYRIGIWAKSFAAFKRNVKVAYTWEPVFIKAVRSPEPNRIEGIVCRDHIVESITLQKGLVGVKPERVCWWMFELLGLDPADEFHDLFPGSGAVTAAHRTWAEQLVSEVAA